MTRERMPDRRKCWTQKVKIEGKSFYLTCGEYPDGRLGEIFLVADKEGTFVRGVLDGVAMQTSMSLQNGTGVADVVRMLRHANFPPRGAIEDAPHSAVEWASSVLDWVAQEVEAVYAKKPAVVAAAVADTADPATPDPTAPEPPTMRGVPVPYRP